LGRVEAFLGITPVKEQGRQNWAEVDVHCEAITTGLFRYHRKLKLGWPFGGVPY
jgi:hypothetical protein